VLEKDARNFSERTPYQYINVRRDWSGKGVNGEGGSDETAVLRYRIETELSLLRCGAGERCSEFLGKNTVPIYQY